MGGDNVVFWGPLAKTVIYGLFIATFLTLIVVPILFFLVTKFKMRIKGLLKEETQNSTTKSEISRFIGEAYTSIILQRNVRYNFSNLELKSSAELVSNGGEHEIIS